MADVNAIAVIPARSGSRGLKDKNVRDLCGRSVLAYTVDSALDSGCFERVVVSTDSPRYGAIAEELGAEVMYRDERLSGPDATTFMVLEDLFGRLPSFPECFGLLQPTSPLRTAVHVRGAMSLYRENSERFDFVVSVSRAEHARSLVHPLDERGGLGEFNEDFSSYRRQDTAEDYSPNGAIFIGRPSAYLAQGHFFGARSLAYRMDKASSVDIDDGIDFLLAEAILKARAEGRSDVLPS